MIICAAIRVDHIVICGLRHCDCYETLHDLNPLLSTNPNIEEGFISHNNVFLDREQAYRHADICGQLSETIREQKRLDRCLTLYTEDLY